MRDDAVIIFTKKDPQRPCVLRLLVQLGYTFSSSNQVARNVMLISKEDELPPRGCLRSSLALAER
ncbi:hypothetical protein T05_15994 [Trichinella murrelli]|uniref:Uncharacterized protein n=1 Tax=Trichinella murrelli TaxID=144512 RepID=A0A0V0TY82_9BILA|nr:hypothetical protein T05_15994 [Trichinella murrelli]